ncbi:MAG: choice-of-anchor J domain-containing protein [Candidatus Cloacimonadaceae bacterium]|nr:choice-of-anchor J domain-containing protein [Candidatus Cloacimonadaceae bacterium]
MRAFLCLVLMLSLPLMGEVVQIGSGTLVNQSLPLEAFTQYSYSQQLYLASEIGGSGTIHSLAFQYSIASTAFFAANRDLKIWLGHTPRTHVSTWIPPDSLVLVFDGQLALTDFSSPLPGQGWLTITLDQSFAYDGEHNLAISVDENSPGAAGNTDEFLCSASTLIRGIVWKGSTNVEPGNIPATGVYTRQAFPNLRLTIDIVNYAPYQPFPAHNAIDVALDASFSWQSDCATFDLWLGTHPDSLICYAQAHPAHSWNLPEPLAMLRTYYWKVIGFDGTDAYASPLWSFTTAGESLSAPQNLSAYYNGTQVRLAWSAPAIGTVVSYQVLRNGVQIGVSTVLIYFDDAVAQGNSYLYQIKAVNHLGQVSPPSNTASVTIPADIPNLIMAEGFELCESFSGIIPGWQNLDLDGSLTWSWDNIAFPGEGTAMAWMAFCPAQTIPPLTYSPAHSGLKALLAMSALNPPNNDWLISRRMHLGNAPQLRFWARSHTADFGLERLRVLVSTTDSTPQSFSAINSGSYISVPTQWTEYVYDLSVWQDQSVYLAWNCVSWDAFALFLDDIQITGEGGYVPNSDELLPSIEPAIYPNPSRGAFSVRHTQAFELEIYDLRGRKIHAAKVQSAFDSFAQGLNLASGIYFVRIHSGSKTYGRKLVILK